MKYYQNSVSIYYSVEILLESRQLSIVPIILCGGSGTRLWPLSRKSFPKQFTQILGETTLFQEAVLRLSKSDLDIGDPVIITNADFRFIVSEQLAAKGITPDRLIIEPAPRNTAPAVLAAALHVAKTDPDTVVLVCPADHLIPDHMAFLATLAVARVAALDGQLVTFGIKPDRPETGYGYLKLSTDAPASGHATPLAGFVEKPDLVTAQSMIKSGDYLWNSGIFMFQAKTIIAAFKSHAPVLFSLVSQSLEAAQPDLNFLRLASAPWIELKDISLDFAVMEKADNLSVVAYDKEWSDLGDWDAVWRQSETDTDGVATSQNAMAIDCTNTLLRSDGRDLEVVGIGLTNIVAIAMNDAVLIADKNRAQDVKIAVDALKKRKAKQATQLPVDFRPWGWFENLVVGPRFQVKRIHVNPGAALSLQSHHHRSEHWIVVEGTAKITIDETVKLISENESVYIPLGATHRLENPGKVAMVLIEVQTGSYLGEDDIVRYEDLYARMSDEDTDVQP
ncbi:MAG: mannose-1-phosphate guanylyltransferase/mannose-6-phosphate isomerase [Paracoccaceae bacterium]